MTALINYNYTELRTAVLNPPKTQIFITNLKHYNFPSKTEKRNLRSWISGSVGKVLVLPAK